MSNLYIPLLPQLSQSSTEVANLARYVRLRLFKLKHPDAEKRVFKQEMLQIFTPADIINAYRADKVEAGTTLGQ